MHKTKLYKLVKSLSKSEFKQLETYIDSPFFLKKNKYPLKLYQALKEYAPKFDADNLTKEVIFGAVFPKVNYNDAKMRNLLTRTVKIVDSYLLYLDNEGDEFGRDKRLSEVYNKRNIESEFFNYSRRLLADLEKVEQKDTAYYFNKFSLNRNFYFHYNFKKRESISTLKDSICSMHNYIALEQVNIELEIINRERIFNEKNNIELLHYSQKLTENNLTLNLISQVNRMLLNNDINLFNVIFTDFTKSLNFLKREDSTNIYMALQNFLGQQGYLDPPLYNNLKFELIKVALKHDLMVVNNYLLNASYINIVIAGNKVQEYEWVKNFIENYQNILHPKNAKFIKNMGLAMVSYEKEEYEEVLNLLSIYSIPSALWIQNMRVLQIRSLFYLFLKKPNYLQPLLNHCAAFEKILKRKNFLDIKKRTMSLNFVKIVRRLTSIIKRKKWNEEKRQLFFQELEKNKLINSRQWLEKLLNEI